MHYCVVVVIEEAVKTMREVACEVARIMEPYGNGIEYDWFQLGGRWTGKFDGYDPQKDPKNSRTCTLCGGTGERKDMAVKNGCNGCNGSGKEILWPTQWKPRKGDTKAVKKLIQADIDVYAVCCDGYGWLGGDEYIPWAEDHESKFRRREKPPLDWIKKTFPRGMAVVVDCHN